MEIPSPRRATAFNLSARNVIVFRAGAIGDTILTFPALSALRAALPAGARITLVGNPALAGIATARGLADAVVSFDAPWVGSLFGGGPDADAGSRLAGCDLAVVWQREPAGPLADGLRASGVPTISLPSLPRPGVRVHVADHLLATLGLASPPCPAGVGSGGMGVLLHPGSGGARKNWPAERFAAVADALAERGVPTSIVAGPADREPAESVRRHLRRADPTVLEPPTIDALAGLLGRCAAFLGNDSGVSHLAAWLGVPTVAVFGPTDPAIWSPCGPRVRVLAGDVACAPCGGACAERRCLRAVTAEDALRALDSLAGQDGTRR